MLVGTDKKAKICVISKGSFKGPTFSFGLLGQKGLVKGSFY
jgi:hypothetical protein